MNISHSKLNTILMLLLVSSACFGMNNQSAPKKDPLDLTNVRLHIPTWHLNTSTDKNPDHHIFFQFITIKESAPQGKESFLKLNQSYLEHKKSQDKLILTSTKTIETSRIQISQSIRIIKLQSIDQYSVYADINQSNYTGDFLTQMKEHHNTPVIFELERISGGTCRAYLSPTQYDSFSNFRKNNHLFVYFDPSDNIVEPIDDELLALDKELQQRNIDQRKSIEKQPSNKPSNTPSSYRKSFFITVSGISLCALLIALHYQFNLKTMISKFL